MSLSTGTKLGPYEIQSQLGSGGMGEVYRARDTTLKRDVAIKVLPDSWLRDPERLRRFELEAQATATLNHPNVVSIFHVGRHNGSPYIVTELLQGQTLRECLSDGAMPLREVLETGSSLAEGLAAAHSTGVIHRDLKPENIFLTKDGRVKILDFGLAKFDPMADESGSTITVQQVTNPGHVLGTVGYMSPEQLRGRPADTRSDIFALGVILYEMVTGRAAFRRETSAETMAAILKEDPPAISQYSSTTPRGLQRVIARCVTKNPEQRFQHASDVGFALEALSDASTGPVAIAPAAKLTDHTMPLWIAVAIAVVSVVAIAFYLWQQPTAQPIVEAVKQLTDDAVPKSLFNRPATDGTRIYFSEGEPGSQKIAEVAASGGATAILPINLPDPRVRAFSGTTSSLLVTSGETNSLWTVPVPAGEPRRLGDTPADDAVFMPDGRVVYAIGRDLYLAERDRSNPRKLVSIDGDSSSIYGIAVSPDGTRIALQARKNGTAKDSRMMMVDSDGMNLRTFVKSSDSEFVCCPSWSRDGRYVIYSKVGQNGWNLWGYQSPSRFRRSGASFQLTTGPLLYTESTTSPDGNQIFAVGFLPRGELVRYDMQAKQFVPFLSGISGWGPTFSTDGKWVAYTSYPNQDLWVSRPDGSERRQLTFSPMTVRYPFISPDGKRVAFGTPIGDLYVIDADGADLQKIGSGQSFAPNWSPDGKRLVFTRVRKQADLQFRDMQTGEVTDVPDSTAMDGAQWVGPTELVAQSDKDGTLNIFDVKTRTWSTLVSGTTITNYSHSPDWKYFYYATGGPEPQVMRIRLADRKSEIVTSLKGIRRALLIGQAELRIAPDGSPILTRDIGTQEMYALTVKWP